MSPTQATAKIFITALKALPKETRDRIITEMLEDKKLREDLIDLAIVKERAKGPFKPIEKFFSETGPKHLH